MTASRAALAVGVVLLIVVLLVAARAGAGGPRRSTVFVALERGSAVAILSGTPWRLLRRVSVPRGPHNASSSPNGRYVAVTSPPADAITLLGADGSKLLSFHVSGSPHDVVFSADSRTLWATAEQGRRVVEFSVPSGRVLRSVVTLGRPHDLDLRPGGRELWVTIDGSSRVEVRSALNGRLLRSPDLGGAPHDIAFAPDGRTVWFSNWASGTLTVASVDGRLQAAVRTGVEPHHFAFGLGLLWVSDNQAGTVVRIDPQTRRVLGRTVVGPSPHHPVTAGGDALVAVFGSGHVAVISPNGRLLQTLKVGPGPHGLAAVPAPTS